MVEVLADEELALIHLISGVSKRLEQLVGTRLKPAGIPIEQFRVLKSLKQHDGRTMGQLAAQIFVDPPNLTKIVDRMIASGLVFRAPDPLDRRKVLVLLSDTGHVTLEQLRVLVEEPDKRLVDGLQRSDVTTLRGILQNLLDHDSKHMTHSA